MSRRHQVEVAVVIAALWLNYALRLRGLTAQGYIGLPAILVGLIVAGAVSCGLLMRSAGVALSLACITGIALMLRLVLYFSGKSPEAGLLFVGSVAVAMGLCYCLLDLWSAWKKPNKAPEPTA